jgi:multiple sugar transport system substrate-binding protein
LIIEKSRRRPNLKKFLPFLLLFLILGGLVFAGWKLLQNRQLPGLPVGQEVSLTYWGLWEPETVFNTVISEYQQAHPKVKINYVQHSPKDYRQRLQSALAREEGPDIFRYHNTWVPMLKKDLSSLPASIMNSATFESLYYPVVRRDLRVGNNYVGIPLEIDGLALFINEEIFESGGKTIPTQLTWDELRKLACELTSINEQGQIEIAGVALGKTENVDHWSDILALMMLQNGAEMSQPTDLSAQQALRYFVMYGQKTAECPRAWDETLPASTIAFAQGKVAMFFGSSWRIFEVKDANPNLRFRVIPVPQLPETNLTWASYWVEGVAQGSKSQEEAWRFVKYLSEKETMEKLFQAQTQLAPSRIVGEPYSRMDMAELLEADSYVGAFIRQAETAESWYLASRTFDNGLNDLMIAALEEAVTLVGEGRPLDQALETYSQKVGQLLSQYQISPSVVR